MKEQLDFELGSELKKLAEDAAKIAGVSSEEAFEYIIESIKRDYEWRLKAREIFERTIAMDFMEIYKQFAASIDVGLDELTNQQKMNALLNHVLHEEH